MNITDQNFDETVADGISVIDFWAPWCTPCQILTPIIEEVGEEMKDKVNVYKMNVDENPDTSGKFGVMSIPTIIIFKNGQVVGTMIGLQPKEAYVEAINKAIAGE